MTAKKTAQKATKAPAKKAAAQKAAAQKAAAPSSNPASPGLGIQNKFGGQK